MFSCIINISEENRLIKIERFTCEHTITNFFIIINIKENFEEEKLDIITRIYVYELFSAFIHINLLKILLGLYHLCLPCFEWVTVYLIKRCFDVSSFDSITSFCLILILGARARARKVIVLSFSISFAVADARMRYSRFSAFDFASFFGSACN